MKLNTYYEKELEISNLLCVFNNIKNKILG